jgi:hypothetical protein
MRRPVRGDVRLASGFGMRVHPLLNERRMHTGVDWATAPGTPILERARIDDLRHLSPMLTAST